MVAQPQVEMVPAVDNPHTRAGRRAAWDKALRRAIENNLVALELVGGAYCVQSASDADKGYVVDQHGSCTCLAARNGNWCCQHAALALALRGIVAWPEFDPEPPAGPACRACDGKGVIHHERLDRQRGPWGCPACGGSGRAAAA